MELIGFSTGSLAYSNYKKAMKDLNHHLDLINSIELSALREEELEPLVNDMDDMDLSNYKYVSFHAPSKLVKLNERQAIALLKKVAYKNINIILHPDVINNYSLWEQFGNLLLIENMDKRKPIGRTLEELEIIFAKLPGANLCFDIAHSRQVDPTMYEAKMILNKYESKLRQIHISEVNSASRHERLSYETMLAFKKVAYLIPKDIPIVIESPVNKNEIGLEVNNVLRVLDGKKLEFAA